ncbi:MAG: peptide deformylase [Synechococcus sp.]|nr:peptide deformylase [Synechococcus sp.]
MRDLGNPQIGVPLPVVQHECDHLDGVLFPDRLSDPTAFGFIPELEAAGLIPAVPG